MLSAREQFQTTLEQGNRDEAIAFALGQVVDLTILTRLADNPAVHLQTQINIINGTLANAASPSLLSEADADVQSLLAFHQQQVRDRSTLIRNSFLSLLQLADLWQTLADPASTVASPASQPSEPSRAALLTPIPDSVISSPWDAIEPLAPPPPPGIRLPDLGSPKESTNSEVENNSSAATAPVPQSPMAEPDHPDQGEPEDPFSVLFGDLEAETQVRTVPASTPNSRPTDLLADDLEVEEDPFADFVPADALPPLEPGARS
jgi:hypothetical protein